MRREGPAGGPRRGAVQGQAPGSEGGRNCAGWSQQHQVRAGAVARDGDGDFRVAGHGDHAFDVVDSQQGQVGHRDQNRHGAPGHAGFESLGDRLVQR